MIAAARPVTPRYATAVRRRLRLGAAPRSPSGSASDVPLPALARHRLVLAADDPGLACEPGQRTFTVAVYEAVCGARVVGRAPADSAVRFELELAPGAGPPVPYRARAALAATGEYEVRLPYPSEAGYVVRSGSRTGSLVVTEADVREGRTVAGPSFEP